MSIPTLLLLSLRALEEGAASTSSMDPGPDLNQYLLISAGMVILVGAVGWFLQRTMSGSIRARADKRSLRIIDVLPMGGKKKLAVVRVYDRTFVLGLGDREISIVSELDSSVAVTKELTPQAPPVNGKAARGQGLNGKSLVRAFEAIRSRVAAGVPRPQPAAPVDASRAQNGQAVRQAVQRAVATKAAMPAPKVSAKSLGAGRGLLG